MFIEGRIAFESPLSSGGSMLWNPLSQVEDRGFCNPLMFIEGKLLGVT
jgi:hypothetical protein